MIQTYVYRGKVTRVVDGDTVDVELDLGFGIFSRQRLRLARIDAEELNSKDPVKRADAVRTKEMVEQAVLGKAVVIGTRKTDLYGRYIAEIETTIPENPSTGVKNLSDLLLESGIVRIYEG